RPEVARLAAGPGREASRPAPCGAPTRHLRLTPQSAIGPHQELSVPGGLFPRPPVGQICVNTRPQVAAPGPRLANASGRRPSNLDRDEFTHTVKSPSASTVISLLVNSGGECIHTSVTRCLIFALCIFALCGANEFLIHYGEMVGLLQGKW